MRYAIDSKQYIDCVTTGEYTNYGGFTGNCPVDYQLIACNTYTPDAALDSWYMESDGKGCYVQVDNWVDQYATGICCKLSELIEPAAEYPKFLPTQNQPVRCTKI